MVIIAIASLVVYPSVRAGSNQRAVRQTLQQFVAVVRRASAMSVLRRETVEVWLWPDRKEYALVTRDAPPEEGEEEEEGSRSRLRSRGLVRGDEEEGDVGEGRTVVGRISLPEIADFGEVEGGRFVAEEIRTGGYRQDDAVQFEFYPTGSSSGGRVELEFDISGRRQTYKLVINPLVSSISMEE